jgi:hypothetical protein
MLNQEQVDFLDSLTLTELYDHWYELVFRHQSCAFGLTPWILVQEYLIRLRFR